MTTLEALQNHTTQEDWTSIKACLSEARRESTSLVSCTSEAFEALREASDAMEDLEAALSDLKEKLKLAVGYVDTCFSYAHGERERVQRLDRRLCRLEAWFDSIERAGEDSKPC